MQNPVEEKPSSYELQIRAMRDALERAARAVRNAEAAAQQARGELQSEHRRYLHSSAELQRVVRELEAAAEENQRLRQAVGEYYHERETLTERIKHLTAMPPAPGLRVVEEDTQSSSSEAQVDSGGPPNEGGESAVVDPMADLAMADSAASVSVREP